MAHVYSPATLKQAQRVRNHLTPFIRNTEDARTLMLLALDAWVAHPDPAHLQAVQDRIGEAIASWDRFANYVAEVVTPRKRA